MRSLAIQVYIHEPKGKISIQYFINSVLGKY